MQDYKLRLVGHSLGGASAALLAIMLRKKSKEELGFSPDIISAVGFGTPPCVSREVAESCASYVSTVVLQVCGIFYLNQIQFLVSPTPFQAFVIGVFFSLRCRMTLFLDLVQLHWHDCELKYSKQIGRYSISN
jgi:hypothetical protein